MHDSARPRCFPLPLLCIQPAVHKKLQNPSSKRHGRRQQNAQKTLPMPPACPLQHIHPRDHPGKTLRQVKSSKIPVQWLRQYLIKLMSHHTPAGPPCVHFYESRMCSVRRRARHDSTGTSQIASTPKRHSLTAGRTLSHQNLLVMTVPAIGALPNQSQPLHFNWYHASVLGLPHAPLSPVREARTPVPRRRCALRCVKHLNAKKNLGDIQMHLCRQRRIPR